MNISEKAAYLKGLADGMKLDESKNESKLLKGIIDLLGDIAHEIDDINENELDLAEEIDQISEDLALIEEELYDDDECCCCDDDDDDDEEEEPVFYEVTCPSCGKTITVDEDVLFYDSIECPSCGEKLEFEFDEDDGEEDDDEEDDDE